MAAAPLRNRTQRVPIANRRLRNWTQRVPIAGGRLRRPIACGTPALRRHARWLWRSCDRPRKPSKPDWHAANCGSGGSERRLQAPTRAPEALKGDWQSANRAPEGRKGDWQSTNRAPEGRKGGWQSANRVPEGRKGGWQSANRAPEGRKGDWESTNRAPKLGLACERGPLVALGRCLPKNGNRARPRTGGLPRWTRGPMTGFLKIEVYDRGNSRGCNVAVVSRRVLGCCVFAGLKCS